MEGSFLEVGIDRRVQLYRPHPQKIAVSVAIDMIEINVVFIEATRKKKGIAAEKTGTATGTSEEIAIGSGIEKEIGAIGIEKAGAF